MRRLSQSQVSREAPGILKRFSAFTWSLPPSAQVLRISASDAKRLMLTHKTMGPRPGGMPHGRKAWTQSLHCSKPCCN